MMTSKDKQNSSRCAITTTTTTTTSIVSMASLWWYIIVVFTFATTLWLPSIIVADEVPMIIGASAAATSTTATGTNNRKYHINNNNNFYRSNSNVNYDDDDDEHEHEHQASQYGYQSDQSYVSTNQLASSSLSPSMLPFSSSSDGGGADSLDGFNFDNKYINTNGNSHLSSSITSTAAQQQSTDDSGVGGGGNQQHLNKYNYLHQELLQQKMDTVIMLIENAFGKTAQRIEVVEQRLGRVESTISSMEKILEHLKMDHSARKQQQDQIQKLYNIHQETYRICKDAVVMPKAKTITIPVFGRARHTLMEQQNSKLASPLPDSIIVQNGGSEQVSHKKVPYFQDSTIGSLMERKQLKSSSDSNDSDEMDKNDNDQAQELESSSPSSSSSPSYSEEEEAMLYVINTVANVTIQKYVTQMQRMLAEELNIFEFQLKERMDISRESMQKMSITGKQLIDSYDQISSTLLDIREQLSDGKGMVEGVERLLRTAELLKRRFEEEANKHRQQQQKCQRSDYEDDVEDEEVNVEEDDHDDDDPKGSAVGKSGDGGGSRKHKTNNRAQLRKALLDRLTLVIEQKFRQTLNNFGEQFQSKLFNVLEPKQSIVLPSVTMCSTAVNQSLNSKQTNNATTSTDAFSRSNNQVKVINRQQSANPYTEHIQSSEEHRQNVTSGDKVALSNSSKSVKTQTKDSTTTNTKPVQPTPVVTLNAIPMDAESASSPHLWKKYFDTDDRETQLHQQQPRQKQLIKEHKNDFDLHNTSLTTTTTTAAANNRWKPNFRVLHKQGGSDSRPQWYHRHHQNHHNQHQHSNNNYATQSSCTMKNNATFPKDCVELRATGATCSGVYVIVLHSFTMKHAYCDMQHIGGGWTVILRRGGSDSASLNHLYRSKKVSFDHTLSAYRQGFGDNHQGEFFFGLDNIYQLTRNQTDKQVLHIDLEDTTGDWIWFEYKGFRIGNLADKFRLYVEDILMPDWSVLQLWNVTTESYRKMATTFLRHNGSQFLTTDKAIKMNTNNDDDDIITDATTTTTNTKNRHHHYHYHNSWPAKCALHYHSGWWYIEPDQQLASTLTMNKNDNDTCNTVNGVQLMANAAANIKCANGYRNNRNGGGGGGCNTNRSNQQLTLWPRTGGSSKSSQNNEYVAPTMFWSSWTTNITTTTDIGTNGVVKPRKLRTVLMKIRNANYNHAQH